MEEDFKAPERMLTINPITSTPAHRHTFKVVYSPAQEAEIPEGYTFDLLFTSPPFFNFEVYTQEKGQSVQDYTGFESWLTQFLFGMLRRFWLVHSLLIV